jgi:hypothetical protein
MINRNNNLSNINSMSASVYYGDGSNLTGVGGSSVVGSWYDNSNQTSTVSTPTPIKTYYGWGNGITVVDNSKLQVEYSGTYNVQFSVVFQSDFVTSDNYFYIWFRKNNIDVDWTTRKIPIQGSENISSFNYVVDLQSGDYIQTMWKWNNDLVNVSLGAIASDGTSPGVPSVIINMWKI